MNRRTIVAAAIQLPAHERSAFALQWPNILSRIEEAAESGAQLIVLPEGTAPAYVMGYGPYDGEASRQALSDTQALARRTRTTIVLGAATQKERCLLNSALVVDSDGSLAGVADKHFLWHFDRQWFAPGETLLPIPTSLGTLGVLVCADGRIPTIARALVDRGAQMLVMPTAWVTSGRDPNVFENAQADLLARVRARENAVPFVAANKTGVEFSCVAYCGKSQIAAADGTILAMASQDRSETILAKVEIAPAGEPRAAYSLGAFPHHASCSQRIAITARDFGRELHERLRILEAKSAIHPAGVYEEPDAPGGLHVTFARDSQVFDPAGLAVARSNGSTLAVWSTDMRDRDWVVAYARTRALELRIYVVVIAIAQSRAFAVDPDGNVIAGTYGAYRLASFTFDPARTANTVVAPGTDVLDGLARAARA